MLQYRKDVEKVDKVVTKWRLTKVRTVFRNWATRVKEEKAMKIEMNNFLIEVKKTEKRTVNSIREGT